MRKQAVNLVRWLTVIFTTVLCQLHGGIDLTIMIVAMDYAVT